MGNESKTVREWIIEFIKTGEKLIDMFGLFEESNIKSYFDINVFHKTLESKDMNYALSELYRFVDEKIFLPRYYLNREEWEKESRNLEELERIADADALALFRALYNDEDLDRMITEEQTQILCLFLGKIIPNMQDKSKRRDFTKFFAKLILQSALYKPSYLIHKKILRDKKWGSGKDIYIYHADQINQFVEFDKRYIFRKKLGDVTSPERPFTAKDIHKFGESWKYVWGWHPSILSENYEQTTKDLLSRIFEDLEDRKWSLSEVDGKRLNEMIANQREKERAIEKISDKMLDILSPALRQTYKAIYMEKKTPEKIAKERKVSPDTVYQHIHRIKEKAEEHKIELKELIKK